LFIFAPMKKLLHQVRNILCALLAGIGLLSTGCSKSKYVWSTEEEYFDVPIWKQHVKAFKKMKYPEHTTTLFIGDSMTEGFDLRRHLGGDSLVNMGISGDFTSGILKRLDVVEKLQPKKIFIMIGINDILKSVPQDRIKMQYGAIIDQLSKDCPNARIFVQSNLPTSGMGGNAEANNAVLAKVNDLNAFLFTTCEAKHISFINMYPSFEATDLTLKPEYTYDGLHLSDAGYVVWSNLIRDKVYP
jgi:lysophospholipase L1-like esterase